MRHQNEKQTMSLQVTDDLTVIVIPDSNHEFLMSTKDVASGYDISENTLRSHKSRHNDELIEGVHFTTSVAKSNGRTLSGTSIFWTKQGVIRLGFYVKSERAKLFRDWVEKLVLQFIENKMPALPETPKRKHNRLTAERLLDIMSDVVKIENSALRLSISRKILEG